MKKLLIALLVAALCLAVPVSALECDDLPAYNVDLTLDKNYCDPSPLTGAYFDVHLLFDDELYTGWCVEIGPSYCEAYAGDLYVPEGEMWNKVNWVLNNDDSATYQQTQAAIWKLVTGSEGLHYWYDSVAEQLVNDAEADFECEEGMVMAVKVVPSEGEVDCQNIIFEFPCCEEQNDIPTPEFPTMMIPVFLVGSVLVAASVLKKE